MKDFIVIFLNRLDFSIPMQGIIVNFRSARHHQYDNHMIIVVEGVDSKEKASKLVGKTVTWNSPGKKTINGQIAKEHGNKGAVRAIFERGMPGQSVGSKVEIK